MERVKNPREDSWKEESVRSASKQHNQQNKRLFSWHNIQGFETSSCADIMLVKSHPDRTTAFQHSSQYTKKCRVGKCRNVENKGLHIYICYPNVPAAG